MDLILLSGGHDSANLVMKHRSGCVALFVDYGQEAAARELAACLRVCDQFKVELMRTTIPPIPSNGDVYLARNLTLISLGVQHAMARGCERVLIGCTLLDHETFPDCRDDFLISLDWATRIAYGVTVQAPLRLRPSYRIRGTWSCYGSGPKPCGTCRSCRQGMETSEVAKEEARDV